MTAFLIVVYAAIIFLGFYFAPKIFKIGNEGGIEPTKTARDIIDSLTDGAKSSYKFTSRYDKFEDMCFFFIEYRMSDGGIFKLGKRTSTRLKTTYKLELEIAVPLSFSKSSSEMDFILVDGTRYTFDSRIYLKDDAYGPGYKATAEAYLSEEEFLKFSKFGIDQFRLGKQHIVILREVDKAQFPQAVAVLASKQHGDVKNVPSEL